MSCRYEQWDGAYVLGALSPAERAQFQGHLEGCERCTRAVRRLAGLPGMLARVPADVLEHPPAAEPVPDSVLPALVRRVRRTQRRRAAATALAAAAVAAAVTAGVILGVGAGGDRASTASPTGRPTSTGTPTGGHRLLPVDGHTTDMTARVALSTVAWGTRLDLTCSYPMWSAYQQGGHPGYALVVRTREGRVEQVATWHALPDRTMHLTAATAVPRGDIAAVEVRTDRGVPVLRLAPS